MSQLQQRTMQLLRDRGYVVGSVERRKRFPARGSRPCKTCGQNRMLDIAHDLFNVFDLICLRPGAAHSQSTVFVQTTSSSNHATRRTKILTSFEAKCALMAGDSILIQSWRKVGNRWQSQDEWITLDMFLRSLPDTVKDFKVIPFTKYAMLSCAKGAC